MKRKKILVTGASGLLGRPVMSALKSESLWEVTGTAHNRVADGLERVDLTDLEALSAFLAALRPDIIIHSAAERRPDVSARDPQGTRRLNVDATAAIAAWAAANSAFLLYISTDYVFDGAHPPYREHDATNPLNDYGRSKLDGEKAVIAGCPEHAVLRVPILYGDVESLEESAVTALAAELLRAQPEQALAFENWAVRHPTLTDDVAGVLRQMLLRSESAPALRGIFHWSADEAMTKYGMACVMADCLGFDRGRIVPDSRPPQGAPRPQNSRLDTSLLRSLGIGRQTPFQEAIPGILRSVLGSQFSLNSGKLQ
jgi:dTDP-4-dehydrorhamnose reductase